MHKAGWLVNVSRLISISGHGTNSNDIDHEIWSDSDQVSGDTDLEMEDNAVDTDV
jgi:hypothetical protein